MCEVRKAQAAPGSFVLLICSLFMSPRQWRSGALSRNGFLWSHTTRSTYLQVTFVSSAWNFLGLPCHCAPLGSKMSARSAGDERSPSSQEVVMVIDRNIIANKLALARIVGIFGTGRIQYLNHFHGRHFLPSPFGRPPFQRSPTSVHRAPGLLGIVTYTGKCVTSSALPSPILR